MTGTGRVALVTGASRGIGAEIAVRLASEGHTVAVGYARDRDGAERTVKELRNLGRDGLAVELDVRDVASVERACASVSADLGTPTILVNNAGIRKDRPVVAMRERDWQDVLDVNLSGPFHMIRACLGGMARQRWGRIVNIGSVAATVGAPGQANYAAAKAGLLGLTRTTAREMARRGVTCNLLDLGPIDDGMMATVAPRWRQVMETMVPRDRLGTSCEVAAAVAFLVGDDASFVTGAVIPVDGGSGMGR